MTLVQTKDFYKGTVAKDYDENRKRNKKKWEDELAAVKKFLRYCVPGNTILDVPVGTGRFNEACAENKLHVYGMDISTSMIAEAQSKLTSSNDADFLLGDIAAMPFKNDSFDYVLCARFVNWLSTDMLDGIFREICRISRKGIILSIRTQESLTQSELYHQRIMNGLTRIQKSFFYVKRFFSVFVRLVSGRRSRTGVKKNDGDHSLARGYTVHTDAAFMKMVEACGLRIVDSCLINTRYRVREKVKQPYRFLYLVKKDEM